MNKKIKLYSDGGARPNPGPGAYGIILEYNGIKKEFSQFFEHTTNNRMELTGVIEGLKKLKEKCEVEIFTDSSYVVNGIEKGWAKKWKSNNWMRTKTEKATNYELWSELLEMVEKHNVKLNWVRGHNGHMENERCDELATNKILDNSLYIKQEKELSNKEIIKKVFNKGLDNSQKNIKITREKQDCKKCGTPVEKAIPKKKNTKNKNYYYRYYLSCPNCKTNYFIEEAKVYK